MSSSNLAVARDAFTVAPNNTINFAKRARAVYIGGAGNVSLITAEGNTVVFTAVPAGFLLPVEAVRINVTGTTATLMVGLV